MLQFNIIQGFFELLFESNFKTSCNIVESKLAIIFLH